jgi:lysophospholipase L1-like esterase
MITKYLPLALGMLFLSATLLIADTALDTNAAPAVAPANPAVIPVPNKSGDHYDIPGRHAAILAQQAPLNPQIVLIGDSITMRWGGPPEKGDLRPSWKEAFGDIPALNLGFGYDLTQNVLWRLDNGEFDGLKPKTVVILVGTNNITGAPNSQATDAPQTVEGIMAIIDHVHTKSPQSKIIVMAVFPRGEKPDNWFRPKIKEMNQDLAQALKAHPEITFLDISDQFLQPDGTLPTTMMEDGTHPSEAGYSIWAKALVAAGVRN